MAAVSLGAEHVRFHIGAPVVVENHKSGARIMRRWRYHRHPGALGSAFCVAVDPCPVFSAITSNMDPAVVGAGPDCASFQRAGRHGSERGVILGRSDIISQSATFPEGLFCRVIRCQVGADYRPCGAAVGGFVQELAAVINCRGIKWVLRQRSVPVEPEFDIRTGRGRADHAFFTRVQVPGR